MSVRVLFFGELAEIAERCGTGAEVSLAFSDSVDSLDKIQAELTQGHAELIKAFASNEHLRSINHAVQQGDSAVNDGDEIAFMSPFSGG